MTANKLLILCTRGEVGLARLICCLSADAHSDLSIIRTVRMTSVFVKDVVSTSLLCFIRKRYEQEKREKLIQQRFGLNRSLEASNDVDGTPAGLIVQSTLKIY